MTHTPPDRGERIYLTLLALLPRTFRLRYRSELRQVFRARRSRLVRRGMTRWYFWADTVRDLLWNAVALRWGPRREPHRISSGGDQQRSFDVSTLLHDLRHAARVLIKQPAFTAVVVLTLGLGIGATTALVGVIDAVLLAPLPYADPDRLVRVWEHDTNEGQVHRSLSPADFFDYQEQNSTLAALGGFTNTSVTLNSGDDLERIPVQLVTPEVFDILGVPPMFGRTFQETDETGDARDLTVLSYGFWRQHLGSDPDIVGTLVTLNGRSFEVLGVMPERLRAFHGEPQLWILWRLAGDTRRPVHFVRSVGRLAPHATIDDARNDLMTIARRLEAAYPDVNTGHLVTIDSLEDAIVGAVRPALLLMLAAVGFVFLIACANLANLFLSRSISRRRELAIRSALGAGRGRLVRLLVTENLALASLGALAGFAVSSVALKAYLAVDPGTLPRLGNVAVDVRLVLVAVTLAVVSAMLFGLIPSYLAARLDPGRSLREGARNTASPVARRLRSGLIVVQMSLAIVLLLGAGLLGRSFNRLLSVDPGFDAGNTITARLSLPGSRYDSTERIAQFQMDLHAALSATPGAQRSGTVTFLPLTGNSSTAWLNILGRPPWPGLPPEVNIINVSGEYFRAMGVTLLRGRLFDERDQPDATRKTVINETMARQYWPDQDPIGQQIRLGPNPESTPWEIVGVVSDMRQYGLDTEPIAASFSVSRQEAWSSFHVVLQMAADATNGAAVLRQAVKRIDDELAVSDIAPMAELVGASVARPRFGMVLLAAFALTALSIAAVGVYGVIAYSVTQRTHEIGVRIALGAQTGRVLSLVLRQGVALAMVATAIGLAVGYAMSQTMESMLFQVSAVDPITFVGVPVLLVLVAAAASSVPALRAARVDPVRALRAE